MAELASIEGGGRPGSALAIRSDQQAFTDDQVRALAKMNGWEKVPRAELAVFFHQAQRSGLDPFARQIYLIGRNNRRENRVDYTIQVGIDGLRLTADRTGTYAGSDRPVFHDWADPDERCAEVTVYKIVQGVRVAYTGVAYWSEYQQPHSPMWKRMPRNQLAKCAESQALRKGWPANLAGLYTHEEMDQAGPTARQPEELGAEVNEEGEVLSAPDRDEAVQPATREPEPVEEAEVIKDVGSEEVEKALYEINDLLYDWPEGQQGPDVERVKSWARQSAENARKAVARVEKLRRGARDAAVQEEATEAAGEVADEEAVPDFGEMQGAARKAANPARKSQKDLIRTLAVDLAGVDDGAERLEERRGIKIDEFTVEEAGALIEELSPEDE